MTSDNGNSQEEPKRQKQEMIDRIIRLSAGETMEQIEANPKPKHEITPREQAAVDALLSSPDELPKYTDGGALKIICFDHPSQEVAGAVVMQAFGVTDQRMFNGLIRQLVNAVSKGDKIDADQLNAAVAMVAGIAPRDPLEAMLAVQMVAVQFSSMRHTRSMLTCDTIDQLDIQERVVNKLMRTFTTQMEALRKHRNGGNQKVVVAHNRLTAPGAGAPSRLTTEQAAKPPRAWERLSEAEKASYGRQLLNVKASLPHGHFRRWVEDKSGITYSQAQRYMSAAKAQVAA